MVVFWCEMAGFAKMGLTEPDSLYISWANRRVANSRELPKPRPNVSKT